MKPFSIASFLAFLLFGFTLQSAYMGWGLYSDAKALIQAQAQSVRTGGAHSHYYGGHGFFRK